MCEVMQKSNETFLKFPMDPPKDDCAPQTSTNHSNSSSISANPTKPPPPDESTDVKPLGIFGWESIDQIPIPYIVREQQKLVCGRIVTDKIFSRYDQFFSDEVTSCLSIQLVLPTQREADLLNDINENHADRLYGNKKFNLNDKLLFLDDCIELKVFLDFCLKVLVLEIREPSNKRCGFINIDTGIVPYILKGSKIFVPLFYFDGQCQFLEERSEIVDGWDLMYLKLCCAIHDINKSFYNDSKCKVVAFDEVLRLFPANTKVEKCWPEKLNKKLLVTSLDRGRQASIDKLKGRAQGDVLDKDLTAIVEFVASLPTSTQQSLQQLSPNVLPPQQPSPQLSPPQQPSPQLSPPQQLPPQVSRPQQSPPQQSPPLEHNNAAKRRPRRRSSALGNIPQTRQCQTVPTANNIPQNQIPITTNSRIPENNQRAYRNPADSMNPNSLSPRGLPYTQQSVGVDRNTLAGRNYYQQTNHSNIPTIRQMNPTNTQIPARQYNKNLTVNSKNFPLTTEAIRQKYNNAYPQMTNITANDANRQQQCQMSAGRNVPISRDAIKQHYKDNLSQSSYHWMHNQMGYNMNNKEPYMDYRQQQSQIPYGIPVGNNTGCAASVNYHHHMEHMAQYGLSFTNEQVAKSK